tara:strand:- start:7801 stop:8118 length:318 start_codon:yes stop_codon:yes gene_type:complete
MDFKEFLNEEDDLLTEAANLSTAKIASHEKKIEKAHDKLMGEIGLYVDTLRDEAYNQNQKYSIYNNNYVDDIVYGLKEYFYKPFNSKFAQLKSDIKNKNLPHQRK